MKKLALITGGTKGIGKATTELFIENNYEVAVIYNSDDSVAQTLKTKTGAHIFKCDVSSYETCVKTVDEIISKLGKAPEILVNNAGITRDHVLSKLSYEDWCKVIDVNLTSCFNMTKAVISPMKKNNYGRIINISSINAQKGQFGQTNYAAAKAGVIGFTKSLARELAMKGITVNAIAPGYIKTDMTNSVPKKIIDQIIEEIPVKRLGNPEEIARAVLFLADKNAGFITGETISINGGHNML